MVGKNILYKASKTHVFTAIILSMSVNNEAKSDDPGQEAMMLNNGPELQWYVQNDNVMGGRSEGGFKIVNNELVFSGTTNTNGGGFSSIRTQKLSMDFSQFKGIKVKIRADGRKYTWSIQTDAQWQGRQISYWADFKTIPNETSEIEIPFSNFVPQFRGVILDGPVLDPSKITEFALYQYDKTDGPFELRLISVQAF